ncbi:hypothetical protein [Kumtagia ephedrae]|jgi:hypothetical protein|uniref:hypothetical protein n=1 Tax=Kumtagia ephedrae TaxID=2116701 RepID=UPI00140308B2|nr:hypothetical protein [Mesorhizobium ephedrae]
MSPQQTSPKVKRRTVLQVLLSIPALALFREHAVPAAEPPADEFVEINGWILKRSDLA